MYNISPFNACRNIQKYIVECTFSFPDTKGKHSRQMGVSKFLNQQRQHGKPALESDNVLQDAGASNTLQVFPGFQEKVSHRLRYFSDDKLRDKRQQPNQKFSIKRDVHILGATKKPGKYLQSDEKRLQLRIRLDDQLTRRLAYQAEDDAEESSFGL